MLKGPLAVQSFNFWKRPHWQRLAIAVLLAPFIVSMFFIEVLFRVVWEFFTIPKKVWDKMTPEVIALIHFTQDEVISADPGVARHNRQCDPFATNYWDHA